MHSLHWYMNRQTTVFPLAVKKTVSERPERAPNTLTVGCECTLFHHVRVVTRAYTLHQVIDYDRGVQHCVLSRL